MCIRDSSCRAGFKRGQLPGSCTPLVLVAQNPRDNSGTSPSDLFLQIRAKWQQRPETPVLVSRIHTSSSHHARHQCSDSVLPATTTPITDKEEGRSVWLMATLGQLGPGVKRDSCGAPRRTLQLRDFVLMGKAEARQWLRPDTDRAMPKSVTSRSQRQPTQSIHVVPASRTAACE